jgi:precorrin-6Y C5,15-methyltransferase (decarboxylating) CbiT subunit
MTSPASPWPFVTPGIPDDGFERLPGIPLTPRELRVQILVQLQLLPDSILWDIGAGTGTIPVEAGRLCPQGQVIAVERDEEVAGLIRRNCDRFGVGNVTVFEGEAPACLDRLPDHPDRAVIEGGRPIGDVLRGVWEHLRSPGRLVITSGSLESLYTVSQTLSELPARNIEVVQASVNRLEKRGSHQAFVALDPVFILSGEKIG